MSQYEHEPTGLIFPAEPEQFFKGGLLFLENDTQINLLVELNPSLKIIYLAGDIGLAAGSGCYATSDRTPQEWAGKSMDEAVTLPDGSQGRTWIEGEKEKFLNTLFRNPSGVKGYRYQAYSYQGRLMDLCVNTGLGVFKGQIGRWVMSVSTDSGSVIGLRD